MVTYQKRPTQYKEVELLPDVDLNPFVEGAPLTVGTVLIPEEGTGLVEIISESLDAAGIDRKSTRLNSSHVKISYAVFCLKKKKRKEITKGTDRLIHRTNDFYG